MSDDPTSATAGPVVPDPGPTEGAPRHLTRSRNQRIIGGVAGGLGEYFGVDPVVFRIGFVLVTLLGGSGILLYVIGWLVIPEDGHDTSLGLDVMRRGTSGRVLGIALIAVAAMLILRERVHIGGRLPVALALLGGGAALLLYTPASDRGDDSRAGSGSSPPTPPTPPPAHAPPPPPVPPPRAPRSPRRRSKLTRATLGVLLLVVGGIGLFGAAEAIDVRGEAYLVAALFVAGLGLVVGAWWGRSRWLIVIGTALTVVLAGFGAIEVPIEGGFGERIHIPDDLTEVERELHLIAGEVRVDYSAVDFTERVTKLEATVVFGQVRVVIPEDVRVIVTAKVNAGDITVLGREDTGIDSHVRRTIGPRGHGLVVINIEVAAGEIVVVTGEGSNGAS